MLSEGTKGGSLHFKPGNIWSPFYKPRFQYSSHLTHCKSSSGFKNYRIFYTCITSSHLVCGQYDLEERKEDLFCLVLTSITKHEERSPLLLCLYRDITIPVLESFQQWQKIFSLLQTGKVSSLSSFQCCYRHPWSSRSSSRKLHIFPVPPWLYLIYSTQTKTLKGIVYLFRLFICLWHGECTYSVQPQQPAFDIVTCTM